MDSLFLKASREKFRFSSPKGPLTTEQLWELPLSSERTVSLDSLAIEINSELKTISEVSFVKTSPNKRRKLLEDQLEILKAVIEVKQAENAAAAKAVANKAERERLQGILAQRSVQAEESLSDEAIQKRLSELESAK